MMDILNAVQLEVEGFGNEIISAAVLLVCTVLLFVVFFLAWKTTGRPILDYELFLVEMHTFTNRRIVELLHIGSNYRPVDSYSGLIERMRHRAQNRQTDDGDWIAVSDTNVVIQSPSTVTASQGTGLPRDEPNCLTLWEIEIPLDSEGRAPDGARDSQLAAAAAISVLGRPLRGLQEHGEYQFAAHEEVAEVNLSQLNVNFLLPSRRTGVVHLPAFRFPTAILLSSSAVQNTTIENPDTSNANSDVTATVNNDPSPTVPDVSTEYSQSPVSSEEIAHTDIVEKDTDIQASGDAHEPVNGITIRLKFLDDTQQIVSTELSATVAQFRNIHFRQAVAESKVVRLIYQGQLLRDDSRTLESYGLCDGCVVHCHISNTPYAQPRNVAAARVNPVQHVGNSNTAPVTGASDSPSDQNVVVDRADLWFARVILALVTSHVTSLPVQLWHWVQHLLSTLGRSLRPTPDSTSWAANLYRRCYETLVEPWIPREDPDPVSTAADAAARPPSSFCIGDYLLWIFGVQCALIWSFVYYFPQLCDRTAFGLLILLTLYFIFVVLRNYESSVPWRTQSSNQGNGERVVT